MSPNDLAYYMEQRYPVVLRELSAEEGGGWFAEIVELPGCMADGDTPDEAMKEIVDSKEAWISTGLKRGLPIPLPEPLEEDIYSGRVTLRMPSSLHRKLSKMAQKEGISLNQFLLAALAFRVGVFEVEDKLMHSIGVDFESGASIARDVPSEKPKKRDK